MNVFISNRWIAAVALLLFCLPAAARSQMSTARGLGMAGAYSNLALGSEAPAYNPANLSYRPSYSVSVSFLGAGLQLQNNAFTVGEYNRYNGTFLSETDQQDILTSIPDDDIQAKSDLDLNVLSIGYRSWAVSLGLKGVADASIARDLLDLAFNGNELDRLYDFNPLQGGSRVMGTVGVSKGFTIPVETSDIQHLGWGLTLWYYQGFQYAKVTRSIGKSLTQFTSATATGRLEWREATGGNGVGIDLGSTVTAWTRWRFSLSVHNALAVLSWNQNATHHESDFTLQDDAIEDVLTESAEYDSIWISQDTSQSIGSFSHRPPATLRLGALYVWKRLFLTSDITGILDSAPHWMLSTGVEYHPASFIALRCGSRFESTYGFSASSGLGFYLGNIRWDIALQSTGGITSQSSRGLAAATQISVCY